MRCPEFFLQWRYFLFVPNQKKNKMHGINVHQLFASIWQTVFSCVGTEIKILSEIYPPLSFFSDVSGFLKLGGRGASSNAARRRRHQRLLFCHKVWGWGRKITPLPAPFTYAPVFRMQLQCPWTSNTYIKQIITKPSSHMQRTFSNFSCRFLNPKCIFQFEFQFL